MSTQLIQRFAESRRLPRSYVEDAERWILPFATGIADLPRKRPHILGINGSQGSGKSTLSALLAELFEERRVRIVGKNTQSRIGRHASQKEIAHAAEGRCPGRT